MQRISENWPGAEEVPPMANGKSFFSVKGVFEA
jgi:hypothetical protein